MIYHPIWSLLSSLFLTGPWFFSKFTAFNAHIFPLSSFIPLPPMLEPPEAFPILCLCEARACCAIKKGGKMRGQKGSDFFARVCTKLFWSIVYWANPIPKPESPNGLRVEPDISIHILEPGSSLQFIKPGNILDGLHKRVIFTRGSATASRTLYFHTNRVMENLSCPFITGNCPSRFTWGIVGTYSDLVPSQLSVLSSL